MLIEFSLGNYKSFKDISTISLLGIKAIRDYRESNLINLDRHQLLKSTVIYGANSSGKSNLIKGIMFMRWFVINSSKETQSQEKINIDPFFLSSSTEKEPSFFEIIFIKNNIKYRYGFEADKHSIKTEWLFMAKKIKEYPLFVRDKENIELFSGFEEGNDLEKKTRENALFLSVAAQFNGNISTTIIKWFEKLNVISGIDDRRFEGFTVGMYKDEILNKEIDKFLKNADLGFDKIQISEYDFTIDKFPKKMPKDLKGKLITELKGKKGYDVYSLHKKYNEYKEFIDYHKFEFDEAESEGTKKYFRLAGPILDTLKNGQIIIIDELDARLHPILTTSIVKLFNSDITNKNNAQLIFATHDTNLLSSCMFRRDQIWFTEKNAIGSTDLYSLAEYKTEKGKIRNDEAFEKNYIKGRYGAIPFIGDFQNI